MRALAYYTNALTGIELNINRFESPGCSGVATMVNKDRHWMLNNKFSEYADYYDDQDICDFVSMNIEDQEGNQFACCNVMITKGKECEKKDTKHRMLAA